MNLDMCYVVELSSLSKVKNFPFFSVSVGKGAVLMALLFARIPEKGILDFIAHSSIIQGITVAWSGGV